MISRLERHFGHVFHFVLGFIAFITHLMYTFIDSYVHRKRKLLIVFKRLTYILFCRWSIASFLLLQKKKIGTICTPVVFCVHTKKVMYLQFHGDSTWRKWVNTIRQWTEHFGWTLNWYVIWLKIFLVNRKIAYQFCDDIKCSVHRSDYRIDWRSTVKVCVTCSMLPFLCV